LRFCTNCMAVLTGDELFCASCGQRVINPAPNYPAFAPPLNPYTSRAYTLDDHNGLYKLQWFAIISLVGSVTGFVVAYYYFRYLYVFPGQSISPGQLNTAFLQEILTSELEVIAFSGIVTGIAYYFLWNAFRDLSRSDSQFTIPKWFTLVILFSFPTLYGSIVLLFNGMEQTLSQMSSLGSTLTSLPPGTNSLFEGFGLLALTGILLLIGFVIGQLLGLWRLASRYQDDTFKVAMIFSIIPIPLVMPIFVMVGVHNARRRIEQAQKAP